MENIGFGRHLFNANFSNEKHLERASVVVENLLFNEKVLRRDNAPEKEFVRRWGDSDCHH